jgi:hypothetical protein
MREHHVDRWNKLEITYNILREDENGIWVNFNKKGSTSWKRAGFWENPTTWLKICDLCGKASTPKKVNIRNDCYNLELWNGTPTLCMGCWNKVRRLDWLYIALQGLKRVVKRIQRSVFTLPHDFWEEVYMSKNRTTETIRELLMDAMDKVALGKMEPKQAKALADLADRVIRTAEIELKYSQVISKLDKDGQGISPGPLLLTQDKEPKSEEVVGETQQHDKRSRA